MNECFLLSWTMVTVWNKAKLPNENQYMFNLPGVLKVQCVSKFVISDHQNGLHYLIPTMAERYIINSLFRRRTPYPCCTSMTFSTSSSIVLSALISLWLLFFPFVAQYLHTNSSRLIFVFDHFINSHNLWSWLCLGIAKRKFMLVTLGTYYICSYLKWTPVQELKINNFLLIIIAKLQHKQ